MRSTIFIAVMAALALFALALSPGSDRTVAGSAQELTAIEMAQTRGAGGGNTEEACSLEVCNGTNGCSTGRCFTYYPHNQCQYTGNPDDNCVYGGTGADSLCVEIGSFDHPDCTGTLTGEDIQYDPASCSGTMTLRNPNCS